MISNLEEIVKISYIDRPRSFSEQMISTDPYKAVKLWSNAAKHTRGSGWDTPKPDAVVLILSPHSQPDQ